MTIAGIVFMGLSWTFIIGLMVFTYRRLLSQNHLQQNDRESKADS